MNTPAPLTEVEQEIINLINDGAKSEPAICLSLGNRIMVVEASIIRKLKDLGLIQRQRSEACETQDQADVPHAHVMDATVCIHGSVNLTLLDERGDPIAMAQMPYANFQGMAIQLACDMDGHVRAGHLPHPGMPRH